MNVVDPRTCFAIGVLLLGMLVIVQRDAIGQHPRSEKSNESYFANHTAIVVPRTLAPLRFGDPLYLPLAVKNKTDEELHIPTQHAGLIPIVVEVKSGNLSQKTSMYVEAISRVESAKDARRFPGNAVTSSVIQLPIWTPEIARSIYSHERAQIQVRRVILDSSGIESERYELVGTCELVIEGSAFTAAGNEAMIQLADKIINNGDVKGRNLNHPGSVDGYHCAFSTGQSPLSWFDQPQRDDGFGDTIEFLEGTSKPSNLLSQSFQLVARDTRLYRSLQFQLLRVRLSKATNGKDLSEIVSKYASVLQKCDPLEQEFQVVTSNSGMGAWEGGHELFCSFIEKLGREFPNHSAHFKKYVIITGVTTIEAKGRP